MNDEVQVIKSEVAPVVDRAYSFKGMPLSLFEKATEFTNSVKDAMRKVENFFDPLCKKTNEAHKAVTKQRSEIMAPLQQALDFVEGEKARAIKEAERMRIAEQQKAQAAADEAARKERERLEREAAKLKTPELREQRLEQAAQVIAPMVQVQSAVPVIAGQQVRKTWKAVVVNVDLVPREYMVVNETALQALARATKGAVKISGVEFVEEIGFATKRG